jgi:hypothetical protein
MKITISKKNLLSLIQENIEEMAMDFDSPDRPDTGVQSKLSQGETPFKKVPLPSTGDEPNKNFQELLASERYKQVVQKVRQYTNIQTPMVGMQNMMPLMQTMMMAHNEIVQTEREHRQELEKLAIDLVMKEFGIEEGDIEFEAKIVGMGEIDTQDFNRDEPGQQQPEMEEVNVELDLFDDLQTLNLEKAKARLIGSMIQGASKRGHYMYHYVAEKIREITGSESLINQYGVLMSINDTLYWQISDEQMKASMGGGGGGNMVGGKESIDPNSTPPKVIAQGLNFPILVHELIKGTLEVIAALKGQSSNPEIAQRVISSENTMEKEIWDLRLGPAIWDRIREQIPEEVLTDENKKNIQLILFSHIVKKPAKEFLVFMKEVISGSENGKRLMKLIIDAIESEINDYDYEETMTQFDDELNDISDETEEDDLKDFLGGLGIDLPSDN